MGRQTEIPTAILPWNLAAAINEIRREDGVQVDIVSKAKSISKFGRNASVGLTEETVWSTGGSETYVFANTIDTVSSTNAGDIEPFTIEGHTIDADDNLTFVVQTVTLNGQNKVTLPTPVARVSRAFIGGQTDLLGDVTVYENTAIVAGAPTDVTKIHISVLGTTGENQSYKAATSTSQFDYLIITRLQLAVNRKQAASVDGSIESRELRDIFRPVMGRISVTSTGLSTASIELNPALIVRPNSDIRFVAIASTAGTEASAVFSGYFAQISRTM